MSSWQIFKEISKPTDKNKINNNYNTSASSNFTNPITVSSVTGFLILSLLVSIALCKRKARSSSLIDVENLPQTMYNQKMAERSANNEDTDIRCNRGLNEIDIHTSPYETIDTSSDDSSEIMSSNSIGCQQDCIFLSQSKTDLSEDFDRIGYLCPALLNQNKQTDKDAKDDKYLTVI